MHRQKKEVKETLNQIVKPYKEKRRKKKNRNVEKNGHYKKPFFIERLFEAFSTETIDGCFLQLCQDKGDSLHLLIYEERLLTEARLMTLFYLMPIYKAS